VEKDMMREVVSVKYHATANRDICALIAAEFQ
jgi:hypothetical protein